MGTRIGTIHANVTAKDLSWTDTMRRVREETKRTADLLQGISDRGGGMGGLGGIMPTIDIGNVINRSIGLVTDAYRALSEAREKAEIKADKADVLGLTMAELQGLSVGAALANTDIETVTGATTKFIKKLSEAAEGSKEARADLAMLGLTIKDFSGLTTADSLRLVAERLNQIQNAGDRANVAISLFGKEAGTKMITVLKGGSAAFDDYIKKAKELGIVLSDAQIAAVRFANTQADIDKLMTDSIIEKASVAYSDGLSGWTLLLKKSEGLLDSYLNALDQVGAVLASNVYSGGNPNNDLSIERDALKGIRSRRGVGVFDAVAPASSMPSVFDAMKTQAEEAKKATEDLTKAMDEAWDEWVSDPTIGQDNKPFLFRVQELVEGDVMAKMRKQMGQFSDMFRKQEEDANNALLRDAQELARQQLDLENATSGGFGDRGGVAAVRGSEDARRLMDASRQYQKNMQNIQRESAAEKRVRDNRRLEQLTQQMLQELRRISTNTANSGIQTLGV